MRFISGIKYKTNNDLRPYRIREPYPLRGLKDPFGV
jgi:hypothetical protein